MEQKHSVANYGKYRNSEHKVSQQTPVSDIKQHNLIGSSTTTSTPQNKVNISSPDTTAKETAEKIHSPKALENLERMVAVMDDEAKRTEAETARRAEEMQNEEFLSETLDIVNMTTGDSAQINPSLQEDFVQDATQPDQIMKNEFDLDKYSLSEKVPEVISTNVSSVHNLPESKGIENKINDLAKQKFTNESTKLENLETSKSVVNKKDQDEQLKIKRQLQIEERDKKLSERKRLKSLPSDRKPRSRPTKNKKAKLTDEAIVQSLKELPPLQLCEPEFLMPSLIIQPSLNGLYRGQTVFRGSFGRSYISGVDDYYANKKFPEVKVCIGNPPTPPTSLPPSPTFPQNAPNKEQRVYDMLAERIHSTSLFPTPPYGDSVNDIKNSRQKFGMFQDHLRTLANKSEAQNTQREVYPAFVIDKGLSVRSKPENSLQKDDDVNKMYGDVNVTLTISAISDKTVHETVNAISELINVDAPSKLTVEQPVRTASAVYLDTNERIGNPHFRAGNNVDERITSNAGKTDVKKDNSGDGSNGPYCRHCDVVILGIGVVRNNSTENNANVDSNDNQTLNYSNVNVEEGVNDGRDIFCSSACLKQYYSLDASETTSSIESSTVTTGLTTSNELVNENDHNMSVRGDEVAEGTSYISLKKSQQKSADDETEVSLKV